MLIRALSPENPVHLRTGVILGVATLSAFLGS